MWVSRQLMECEEAATVCFFLMCSPVKDHGPATWHRDIHPKDQAPLTGLERDILDNAPGVIQWNVPLYDDSVLWVVPGSHRRPNTEAENEQLLKDRTVPLPNSIPVELKAGEGVAYTNTILHWGSNYSAKLRRTIHFGHRAFGGHIYPYVPHFYWTPDLLEKVSPFAKELLGRFGELRDEELDRVTSLFRALIDRDEETFLTELARIHPGRAATDRRRHSAVEVRSQDPLSTGGIRPRPQALGRGGVALLGRREGPAVGEVRASRRGTADRRRSVHTRIFSPSR